MIKTAESIYKLKSDNNVMRPKTISDITPTLLASFCNRINSVFLQVKVFFITFDTPSSLISRKPSKISYNHPEYCPLFSRLCSYIWFVFFPTIFVMRNETGTVNNNSMAYLKSIKHINITAKTNCIPEFINATIFMSIRFRTSSASPKYCMTSPVLLFTRKAAFVFMRQENIFLFRLNISVLEMNCHAIKPINLKNCAAKNRVR